MAPEVEARASCDPSKMSAFTLLAASQIRCLVRSLHASVDRHFVNRLSPADLSIGVREGALSAFS
jgi:hypothetical protein